jgi:1-deoxy-D-xylulose-5-phosphate synthase
MTLDLAHYPVLALADTPETLRDLPQETSPIFANKCQ